MLRTIWFYTIFLGLTPFFCIFMLILGPLDRSGTINKAVTASWSKLAVFLAGISIEADLDQVPAEGPVVFMVNHQSQFDIPIIMTLLSKRYPAFVAKKSLFTIPLLGWCFALGGHIPIDRKNSRKAMKSLEDAAQKAKNGRPIVIYPEGTRQKQTETLGTFKTGGIILALKTGVPVVPIVLEGTGEILPKGHITLNKRTHVRVKALAPIDLSEYTLKDRNRFKDELFTTMNTAYLEMRECRKTQTS